MIDKSGSFGVRFFVRFVGRMRQNFCGGDVEKVRYVSAFVSCGESFREGLKRGGRCDKIWAKSFEEGRYDRKAEHARIGA